MGWGVDLEVPIGELEIFQRKAQVLAMHPSVRVWKVLAETPGQRSAA